MHVNQQNSTSHPPAPFLYPAVFLISAVGIAYQVVLMRVLSIAQWHHFAYMIISIAMLGFGASGTLLTLIRSRLSGKEKQSFFVSLLLLTFSLPLCYVWSQRIPFETFHLVTQGDQFGWLLALYTILAVPFFLVSTCITLAFFMAPRRVGRVYFTDLVGSGLGAAAVVGLLFLVPPEQLPYLLSLPLILLAGWMVFGMARPWKTLFGLSVGIGIMWVGAQGFAPIRVSDYKTLSYTLQFPDAEIVASAQSPLSQIHVVRSRQIRETPGQLGNYPFARMGPLPEQAGLFFDAGSVSVVNRYDGDTERFSYMDYVTPALAYRMVREPEVLVIGAGGGSDVWMALYHGAKHVTAVEVDPSVFRLIEQELADFSGGLYRRDDVTPVTAEGRGYLQSRGGSYGVIHIALLDAFNAAASGVYALSESYLYTREAVSLYMDHLTDDGVLAITRWLKTPARDAIKMFATLVEACEAAGYEDPGAHLAFIRSWNAGTLLLSRTPWTDEQLDEIRAFSQSRGFDIAWMPGVTEAEVNRFTILEEPVYYQAALAILSEERDRFYRDYLFDVRPATDDRPYFFQFFKWDTLRVLVRDMGFEWVPFVEWGYIALLATLVQGAVASVLFILLPLITLTRRAETRGARRWVVMYFTALGLAFMFLEIAFIQKFMLFLTYPIYAVAVVLTAFLVFSGCGAFLADRWRGDRFPLVRAAVGGIVLLTLLYTALLPPLFSAWAGWPDAARVVVSFVLIAPLAFCMGIPFPSGLQLVSDRYAAMVPWAWGINGFASVMGASLATFTAIHFGFRILVWTAAAVYVLCLPAFMGLRRRGER